MSRSKRFIASLLSSYVALGVNIIYTLASVPLALAYLGKEEFGLWALVTQISGYLMLFELGMSGSVARTLSDHKDHLETGVYGSILKTGARVFFILGCIIAVIGMVVALIGPSLLALPERLHTPFTILMAFQAVLTGFRLATASLGAPLWCHQRLDLSNLASSVSLVVSLITLWLGFHMGLHLYSIVAATATMTASSILIIYISCSILKLYPSPEFSGKYNPVIFKELFHFGGGLFVMNLGAQLATASQIIVVSRFMGIETAAIWSIATKVFTMAQQFVLRIFDSAAGGLAEMNVRNEFSQLQNRFRDIVSITAVMAVICSAGIALMNSPFIELWTSGKITWKPWNDYLLACVLFTTTVTRCHVGLTGITKQIQGMKYIYLIEGLAFVLCSIWLVRWMGFGGLLIASLICNAAITGIYGNWLTSRHFNIPFTEPLYWVARPFIILIITGGLYLVNFTPALSTTTPLLRLIINGGTLGIILIPVIWILGISPHLRAEVKKITSKILHGLMTKIKDVKS